jgi:hypothetical protein
MYFLPISWRRSASLTAILIVLFAGAVHAEPVTLAWDASADASVTGYTVYVGTVTGTYGQSFNVGNITSFTYPNAVAGQRYYFAVKSYTAATVYSGYSAEISGFSNAPPVLTNPGSRTNDIGQPASLQLAASDPYGQPLTYSATGLPPGLSVMSSTGLISGAGTAAGTYSVTATATDGVLSHSQSFSWTIRPASDTVAPTVLISLPTSSASYSAGSGSLSLGGSSSDNVGVTQVTWSNSRGGSGTAIGTASWSAGAVAIQSGSNVINVVARDAAGNASTATLTVTYSANTPPTIAITSPAAGTSIASGSTATFTATASDVEDGNVASRVQWSSNVAGSLGTGASVQAALAVGAHIVTASVTDNGGLTTTAQIAVTVAAPAPPPPSPAPAPSVVLSATVTRTWFSRNVNLSWTSNPWSKVDAYRNGVRFTTTSNDGSHVDSGRRAGTYRYKVCEAGKTTCSNEVTVVVK